MVPSSPPSFLLQSLAPFADELSQLADQNAAQWASGLSSPHLTLFCHCFSQTSDPTAVEPPSLCCLITFLSNQPDGRFDYLLLPLTLLAFLLPPAVPWPARSSPVIPSDPPLVPLADQLYFYFPQQFSDPLLRPSTRASDQLPDISSFGVLFDMLAVDQTSLEFYSRNCVFFTFSLTLPLGIPRWLSLTSDIV